MRVLFITNDGGGRLARREVRAPGLDITVATFTFEDLARFRRPPVEEPVFDRRALDRAVAETEGFDGVLGDAPELLLLHYVRTKRGMRRVRWVVNVVDPGGAVRSIRLAVKRAYGEDPLHVAAADPAVRIMVTTTAHVEAMVAEGVPRERLLCLPSVSALQEALQPGAVAAYEAPEARPLPESLAAVAGGVLVPGINQRDFATAARAAEIGEIPVHVLTDRRRAPFTPSRFVVPHDPVPLAGFVAAVAQARLVVVPLRASDASGGQQTVAIAQRVRTLVVASDVPAMEGYVTHGGSGILVAPEDPEALAAAMKRALSEAPSAAMLQAGFERDARDGVRVVEAVREAYLSPLG
jgi:hypothetical protein